MSTSVGSVLGDDPSLAPDVGVDPSMIAPDPFSFDQVPIDPGANSGALIYGPTIAQLGANPDSVAVKGDPSAFNSSATTAPSSGPTVLDDILGMGKIGASIATAIAARGGSINTPVANSKAVATAKSPTSGAGTIGTSSGMSIFIIAIVAFIGIFLVLELRH